MSTDEAVLHSQRTSASSYRVPTPPRIVVPPLPPLGNNGLPEITLNAIKNAAFLDSISYQNIVTQNAVLEWTYERRRHAQLILPYLFMGPMTAAKDEAFLRKEGITCLIGVRSHGSFDEKMMVGAMRKAQEMGLECHPVALGSNQDLVHSFSQTTALIYNHIAAQHQATGQLGNVLVFCESGNERSAGVVAAYVMETHENVDHIKAMQLVQAQRFSANFEDGMKRLLQGYWDILCARRVVQQATRENGYINGNANGNGMPADGPSKPKRSLERDEDEDQNMGGVDEDDLERFGGRTFAPFSDQPPL